MNYTKALTWILAGVMAVSPMQFTNGEEVKITGEFLYFLDGTQNHIKYRLTNGAKSDILSFVNNYLDVLEQTIKE